MIEAATCVIVKCVRCGGTDESDWRGTSHFATAEDARLQLAASDSDRAWQWGTFGPECPGCLRQLRELSCGTHEWELEWWVPPASPTRLRQCVKCGKSDSSRDAGTTWMSDMPTALPVRRGPWAGGVMTVKCLTAACDDCGDEAGEDYTVHHASEAELRTYLSELKWRHDATTGHVLCLHCADDASPAQEERIWVIPGQLGLFAGAQSQPNDQECER